ncbi:MAG: hypothetical protein DMG07_20910 [Acidobacteria bacterium]|nr:MAG: hypothetical protein DMG07_20910 [Acidobacteriota bacterium]
MAILRFLLLVATLTLLPQTSTLRVRVRERATGRATPARIYLTDAAGKLHAPPGAIVYDRGPEHHFITKGEFQVELAPGGYTLEVERGPEFLAVTRALDIAAGQARNETIDLERWIDMNRLGWYSGDLHNHRAPAEVPDLLLAEDLNFAPTLADWVWADAQRSGAPQTTEPFRAVDATHAYSLLDKEVERLEHGPGAVDLVGLRSPVPFEGYRLYPPSSKFCEAAHAQGAYVDAEKIVWRDVAALVALGHVDFAGIVHNHFNRHSVELETDRWGMIPKFRPEFNTVAGMPLWSMEVYYRLLNCGFRLAVSAGSASGVKAAPLGYNRVYVKTSPPFRYERCLAALKQGRSFATNGPMLFLTVDGREPGSILRSRAPARVKIRAEALSTRPLERVEILFRGRVLKKVEAPSGSRSWTAELETTLDESGWVAARCFEPAARTIRFAHTSPVYVEIGSKRAPAGEDARFFIDWIDREIDFYSRETGFREPAHRDAMIALFKSARGVYERLAEER